MTKTKKAAEDATEETMTEETTQAAAPIGDVVYCGPSVRGVARQYTVYHGGIPAELQEFAEKHRAAMSLIVPLERFAETRKRLETKGTAEAVLYEKTQKELKEEN